jgi:hypothetical protein
VIEMPEVVKCGICHKKIHVKNFADQMKKIREHRKAKHPQAFRKSVKKAVATRKRNRK